MDARIRGDETPCRIILTDTATMERTVAQQAYALASTLAARLFWRRQLTRLG
jgi:hypothetical protein